MDLASDGFGAPSPAMSTIDFPVIPDLLDTRVFRMENQVQFAEFSGDFNPMHMSLAASRRTQAGSPAVHGMHQVLWALDTLRQFLPADRHIERLRAQFRNFLLIDEDARLSLIEQTEAAVRLCITAQSTICTDLVITLASGGCDFDDPVSGPPPDFAELGVCQNLSFDEAETAGGNLSIRFGAHEAQSLFPGAVALIGVTRVTALGALSRLVGMVCPGLHSLFSSLDIGIAKVQGEGLQFSISHADRRFSFLRQAVKGGGIEGTIKTFLRPPPTSQPHVADIQPIISRNEFAHSIALVVGASRGLGEFTAKTIGAGGGRVIATYHVGGDECDKVAHEIRSCGGVCDILSLDVRKPIAQQLETMPATPTSMYYFATAKIFGRQNHLFDAERFNELTQIYLSGFFNLCSYLRSSGLQSLRIFYPSSIAVESRPLDMGMYAMAKAVGEMLCEDISRSWPEFKVIVRRLPRLVTDQTATVLNVPSSPVEDVLLPIIRKVENAFPDA